MSSNKLRPLKNKASKGVLSAALELYQIYSNGHDPQSDKKLAEELMKQCIDELQFVGETPKNKIYFESLKLINFRRFDKLEVHFEKDLTVIVGVNGAGKTSIIDAITRTFSYLNARIIKFKRPGRPLTQSDVKVKCYSTAEAISVLHLGENTRYDGSLVRAADGIESSKDSELDSYHNFSSLYRATNDYCRKNNLNEINLPLFVSYTVERTDNKSSVSYNVAKVPKISLDTRFDALDSSATDGSTNLDLFLEWYIALYISMLDTPKVEYDSNLFQQISSLEQIVDSDTHSLWGMLQDLKKEANGSKEAHTDDLNYRKLLKQRIDDAIFTAVPDIKDLIVETSSGRAEVKAKILDEYINIKNLSKGQQVTFSLVADISKRLSQLNPNLDNPFNGQGVILIDELELHLHPSWQQLIINTLVKTFKNIQFIVTTHSPQILSTVHSSKLRLLGKNIEGDDIASKPLSIETFAHPSSDVMQSIMGVNPIPHLPVIDTLEKYRLLIEQGDYEDPDISSQIEKFQKTLFEQLGENHPELIILNDIKVRRELLG